MKKYLLLLFGVLCGFSVSHAQRIISLIDARELDSETVTTPTRTVKSNSSGIEVTYLFKAARIMSDPLYEQAELWQIDGFGREETPSKPSVLYRLDMFNIPVNQVASVNIVEYEYKDYDSSLGPARPPLPDDTYDAYSRKNVPNVTLYSGFYPSENVEIADIQVYRGTNILYVRVAPIQYNVSENKVRVCTKLRYQVSFTDAPVKSLIKDGEVRHIIAEDDNLISNIAINGERPETDFVATSGVKDYLIITSSKYLAAANSLAEWKKLLGFRTHVISKSNWTVDLVKSEVKAYYNSHKSLYYLLIIGDHDDVPAQSISTGPFAHVSDFFYGCMDGDQDVLPDIYRGRLSVSSMEEAYGVVNKIINYERNPYTSTSFYQTGLNCAYFQDNDNDGYADRRFAQTSEDIRNYVISRGKTINRVYYTDSGVNPQFWNNGTYSWGESIPAELKKPTFSWTGNANDITTAINNGVFYVLHRDHGGTTLWGDPYYTTANINGLANGNKLPVVFSLNCLTGKINHSSPCFAEAFLRKTNGGCVGIFAATETSYSGYNDALACGMFDAIWSSPGLRPKFPGTTSTGGATPTPTYALGQILDQGIIRMAETYGARSNYYAQYTRELFHCFGDPSMRLYTQTPTSFSGVTVSRSNGVTVSLPISARITFYNLNTNEIISSIGKNATYPTSTPQNVTVCISDHNKIPYISYGKSSTTVYIQNETVNGPRTISGDRIVCGSNVTASKAQGPVTFNSGSITLSGSEIQINPNTTISGNSQFKAEIK